MKNQLSSILRYGASALAVCLLATSPALQAQETRAIPPGAPPPGNAIFTIRTGEGEGGGFGLVINGSDAGTIILKACDRDGDGKMVPGEFKEVIATCFAVWDANTNGSLSAGELGKGLKALFPSPPPGGMRGARVINGVAVEVSPDELPTPDAQVAKHILAGADSNQDGALTLPEITKFLLGKCFSQWDQDGNGSLDAQELNAALGQLAVPD